MKQIQITKCNIFKRMSVLILSIAFIFTFAISLSLEISSNKTEPVKQAIVQSVVYTGAAEATDADKGGFSIVGNGSSQTINGGRIKGYSRKYGGAFYVADGGVLTINNVTITECTARYGGAIYIENGGTVRIHGGSITNNGALYAPAIFVEDGGVLELDGTTIIEDNIVDDFFPVFDISNISQDTIMVGHATNGVQMHYIEFGTYPRTYVTEESCGVSQETLTAWLETEQPEIVKSYVVGDSDNVAKRTWNAYRYTDGNIYAYGTSIVNDVTYTYADGNPVVATGTNVWFKVEPIKWIVLNYEEVMSRQARAIEVMAYEVIASNVRLRKKVNPYSPEGRIKNEWYQSDLREWLNNQFLNSAFSQKNKLIIKAQILLNNKSNSVYPPPDDGTGVTTLDKVYAKSYHDMSEMPFNNDNYRLKSPTDFALSNNAEMNKSYSTATRPSSNPGTSYYHLRSSGYILDYGTGVSSSGGLVQRYNSIENPYYGVCPVLSLNYD